MKRRHLEAARRYRDEKACARNRREKRAAWAVFDWMTGRRR